MLSPIERAVLLGIKHALELKRLALQGRATKRTRIVELGSGWCLGVPIRDLSEYAEVKAVLRSAGRRHLRYYEVADVIRRFGLGDALAVVNVSRGTWYLAYRCRLIRIILVQISAMLWRITEY